MERLVLKVIAVLMGLRGVGNCLKVFGFGSTMVVFGQLMPVTHFSAPLIGVIMLVYAYGLFAVKPFALPLGIAYALFATANVILFWLFQGLPEGFAPLAYVVFAIGGIGIPWAAVFLLRRALEGRSDA